MALNVSHTNLVLTTKLEGTKRRVHKFLTCKQHSRQLPSRNYDWDISETNVSNLALTNTEANMDIANIADVLIPTRLTL